MHKERIIELGVAAIAAGLLASCAAPPAVGRSVKLVEFKLALAIISEKLADTEAFNVIAVALLAGDVEDTVGGLVSRAAPVVNCQL